MGMAHISSIDTSSLYMARTSSQDMACTSFMSMARTRGTAFMGMARDPSLRVTRTFSVALADTSFMGLVGTSFIGMACTGFILLLQCFRVHAIHVGRIYMYNFEFGCKILRPNRFACAIRYAVGLWCGSARFNTCGHRRLEIPDIGVPVYSCVRIVGDLGWILDSNSKVWAPGILLPSSLDGRSVMDFAAGSY